MTVRQISRIWFSSLFLFMGWGFVQPLLPIFFSSEGISSGLVGILFSSGALLSSFIVPNVGRLSDTHGRRLIFATSTLAVALVIPLYSIATGFYEFLLLTVLFTITTMSSQTVLAATSLDQSARLNYGKMFGSFRISGSIGWIIGTALGGFLASLLGLRSVFVAAAFAMVVSAMLAMIRKKEDSVIRTKKGENQISIMKLLTNREIRIIFAILSLSYIVQAAFSYFLPIYLQQQFAAPSWLVGVNFSIMSVAEIPAMMFLGAASDKFGRWSILLLCLAFYPIRLILTGFIPSEFIVTAVQLLHGLTFGGLYVVAVAYICDVTPENTRGASLGVIPASQNIGTIIGAYLVGSLISDFGFSQMFLAMTLFSLIPILILLTVRVQKGTLLQRKNMVDK